jgi:hypothetical protein
MKVLTLESVGPVNEEILVLKFRLASDFKCLDLPMNSDIVLMWEGRQTFNTAKTLYFVTRS